MGVLEKTSRSSEVHISVRILTANTRKLQIIFGPDCTPLSGGGGRISLAVQWLKLLLVQGLWFQSLLGEQRSHMPLSQKNQDIKQKQYSNKFNKDFKIKKEEGKWGDISLYDRVHGYFLRLGDLAAKTVLGT